MLKERQKLPNPQVDTKLSLPDRVMYHIHYNRKYTQESDAACFFLILCKLETFFSGIFQVC